MAALTLICRNLSLKLCQYRFVFFGKALTSAFTLPVFAMAIFVYIELGGTALTIEIDPTAPISDIKTQIQDETGIHPDLQQLIFAGKVLCFIDLLML